MYCSNWFCQNVSTSVVFFQIIDVKLTGCGTSYRVHYAEWNKRHDEWVTMNRIVDVVSPDQVMATKAQYGCTVHGTIWCPLVIIYGDTEFPWGTMSADSFPGALNIERYDDIS